MRKINKIIASNVIKNFRIQDNYAFNILLQLSGINNKLTIDHLGYLIGPIINSGGRLNSSNYGVELLSTDNLEIIKDRSNKLIALNNKRKIIEQNIQSPDPEWIMKIGLIHSTQKHQSWQSCRRIAANWYKVLHTSAILRYEKCMENSTVKIVLRGKGIK